MFKPIFKVRNFIFMMMTYAMSLPARADLPVGPTDLTTSDNNYAGGIIHYGLTILGYVCYLMAGIAFVFVGYEMISAYQEAKKQEKLSHFFVWSLAGAFTLAACLGLLYAGNELITNAPKPT